MSGGSQFPVGSGLVAPTSPWHMWGTSVPLAGTQLPGGNTLVTQQVSRVNYKRPDTWRFWLGARLIRGTPNTGAAPNYYRVMFSLQLGVGRSVFLTPAALAGQQAYRDQFFAVFRFEVLIGETPGRQGNNIKWATSVPTPVMNDSVATSFTMVDRLVAQDIQCSSVLHLESAPAGYEVEAEATAYFAPNVHIRPDWNADVSDAAAFRGGELGGS
jgi:hypothetical protein